MSYDNTNSGTLGKNRYKEKPQHPDVKGMVKELDDEAIKLITSTRTLPLAGWTKVGRDDEKFISLSVDMHYLRKIAGANEAPDLPTATRDASGAPFDDSIPFARERSWP